MSNPFQPKPPPVTLASLFGRGLNPPTSPIARALLDANKSLNPPTLGSGLNPFGTQTPPPFGSLFGLANLPSLSGGLGAQSLGSLSGTPPKTTDYAGLFQPKVRNVFYSFHYADVLRVNHIRKAGKFRTGDKVRDRSLWEKVRRTNPANLKRVINGGLGGTSVTCVLAGHETWWREWCRYEIAQSLVRGNGLVTVFIDGCKCPNEGYGVRGENPLAYMAVGYDYRIYEYRNGGWWPYDKITSKLATWPKWLDKPLHGHVTPLSQNAACYDWIDDDGHRNLLRWTHKAAIAAGK